MIHFDPPLGPLVPAVPLNKAQTEADIEAAFAGEFPKPLPAALDTLSVRMGDVAGALFSDAKGGLLPSACLWMCRSLVLVAPNGHLVGAARLASLPTHTKRVMSEISAAAISLAACEAIGFDFFCTVAEFNKLFAGVTKQWKGDGPDYLVWDTATGDICFLESKGVSTAPGPKPPAFKKKKAQSLNAVPIFFNVQAHILSVSYLAAGAACRLRWFNHRQMPQGEDRQNAVAGLGIALQQFVQQMINAGFEDLALAYRAAGRNEPMDGGWPRVVNLIRRHFVRSGRYWLQRAEADVIVAVHRFSFRLFYRAACELAAPEFGRAHSVAKVLVLVTRVERPVADGERLEGRTLVYQSRTGVSLLQTARREVD